MKFDLPIIIVTLFTLCFTEVRGQQPPNFDAVKSAGIVRYKSEKMIKKLKITDDSIKIDFTKQINAFNLEMDNLLLLHSDALEDLEDEFDRNVEIAVQTRNRNQMNGVKSKIQEVIPPIRLEVQTCKEVLNNKLAQLLTEEQNKKWLRYQKNKK